MSLDGREGELKENRKFQLKDPWRVEIIQNHRLLLANPYRSTISFGGSREESVVQDISLDKLQKMKPILLIEMDYSLNKTYTGRVIKLKSLEPVLVMPVYLSMIVEDTDGDSQRCIIHNYQYNAETVDEIFGIGCKFSIINPHLRTGAADNKPFIKVTDPATVILHRTEGVRKMCRYCGIENAEKHCAKCKTANYCDRDCQTRDWKVYKHKHLCA